MCVMDTFLKIFGVILALLCFYALLARLFAFYSWEGGGVSVPFITGTALIGGVITLFIKARSNQENTGDRRATPSSGKDSSYPESPLFLYISVAYTSPTAA
jgi:hypothetical protein